MHCCNGREGRHPYETKADNLTDEKSEATYNRLAVS